MARYFDPPKDYSPGSGRPGLVLQLRERKEGGDLRPQVHQIPLLDPIARSEAVVLVHGFNNHYGEAGTAYDGFRLRQYERGQPRLIPPALEKIIADLFWPGDAAWGRFDLVDFLVYPAAVGTARDAGPRLAEHLRSMPTLRSVHFVAHSLGCRVVLETIDNLQREGGPVVGKVCLMAAAVPVFKVRSGGDLADAMAYPEEVCILYSDDDTVLHYAFPPGQTVAPGKDEGFFPTALGRYGPPPHIVGHIDAFDIDGANHGDYWGHSKRPAVGIAADHIADFFRFGLWQRKIVGREPGMAPRSAAAGHREIGSARAVR